MCKLLALGDSHLEALQFAAGLGLLTSKDNKFCIVPGATAVGLRNPNSLTDALGIFRASVDKQDKNSYVLLHLGEVDCGFVIWWRALKHKESINKQLNDSLNSYTNFVLELRRMGFEKIGIAGASLPTIRNGVDFGDIANKRSEINIDINQRTQLTLKYNSALKEFAACSNFYYSDITDAVLDKEQGRVSDFFRNPDPTDHHLDKNKVASAWAFMCNKFLET